MLLNIVKPTSIFPPSYRGGTSKISKLEAKLVKIVKEIILLAFSAIQRLFIIIKRPFRQVQQLTFKKRLSNTKFFLMSEMKRVFESFKAKRSKTNQSFINCNLSNIIKLSFVMIGAVYAYKLEIFDVKNVNKKIETPIVDKVKSLKKNNFGWPSILAISCIFALVSYVIKATYKIELSENEFVEPPLEPAESDTDLEAGLI